MPEATYKKETNQGIETYVCLIPDASKEGGVCGWRSADLRREDAAEGFTLHMQQAHGGTMIEGEPGPQPPPEDPAPDEPPPTEPQPEEAPA